MRKGVRQSAFSLIEMVVVMATILILAGALFGVGEYLKTRANVDLTRSELEVIVTALEQYYDDWNDFPFVTDVNGDGVMAPNEYDQTALEVTLGGDVVANGGPIPLPVEDISSHALFYFLDKNPNSRMIAEALTDSLINNKEIDGYAIQLEQPSGSGVLIDLPRFIDVWGMSIRYEYINGTAFPVLTSAGPDKKFNTPDDIVN